MIRPLICETVGGLSVPDAQNKNWAAIGALVHYNENYNVLLAMMCTKLTNTYFIVKSEKNERITVLKHDSIKRN